MKFPLQRSVRYLLAPFGMCALIAGCADSGHSSKTTAADHQAAVLKDPFSYGGDTEKVDITGGGISEYDKKAMKRDVDSVLSP